MSRHITIEGKSVEDALEEASRRVGRPVAEAEVRVLENRKGFWGMNRKIVLELDVPDDWVDPEAPAPATAVAAAADVPAPAPRPASPPAPAAGGDPEAALGRWMREMIDGTGLELDVAIRRDGDRVLAELSGHDARRLSANHGELLGAFQYLAGKLASRNFGPELRVEVDAGGFREKRAADLEALARRTAEAVKKNRRRAILPPMSPAERRQIHVALAGDPDVTTESEGEGYRKRVAVFLRGDGGTPADRG